jgi:hypothetical protein
MQASRLALAAFQAEELARQLGPRRDDLSSSEAALLERSIKQSCKKAWSSAELLSEQDKQRFLDRFPGRRRCGGRWWLGKGGGRALRCRRARRRPGT